MKLHLFLAIALALLVTAWVTGCSGGTTPTTPGDEPIMAPTQSDQREEATAVPTQETQEDQGVMTPTPVSHTEEETMTPEPAPEPTELEPSTQAEEVVQLAREDLARRLELEPDAITVVSLEAVDWPDASLGCPQPGMVYAQVITPGFLVVLEAEGRMYEYHSGGEHIVLCEETADGYPRPAPIVVDGHPWMPRNTDIEPTPPRR